ncbi:MAG: PilT/PilU family type 4a pilus ATPase [Deltaproteobacteria bacterium]|nr:PilT/PilU family type 4a pilus ATPase [Deltaproteobacteria bacterium]
MISTKPATGDKLGEILVKNGLIGEDQLKEALKRQYQQGGFLGTNLIMLGYIDEETLMNVLSSKLGIQSINLTGHEITPLLQRMLPFDKVKFHNVLPVALEGNTLIVAMADPTDLKIQYDLEYTLRRSIRGVLASEKDILDAIAFFEKEGYGERPYTKSCVVPSLPDKTLDIRELLKVTVEENATDLLITAGVAPCLKINNKVTRLKTPSLTPGQVEELVFSILTENQKTKLQQQSALEFAYSLFDMGRFRINIYFQRGSLSLTARNLMERIPSLEELGLPGWVREYALRPQGLILVTGPAGHGKSTTIASLIEVINTHHQSNIITIEDPIEFLFQHKNSNVNQREVGTDTASFSEGLRNIFRQSPDVIMIGELRDYESISIALSAAETGHLVLGTLHTLNATATIDRLINVFPGDQHNQIRAQLAESLLLILSQRLVLSRDGKSRVLAYEKLTPSSRVRNLIRIKKIHQLRTQMLNEQEDFESIDSSLIKLAREGKIRREEALKFADNQNFVNDIINKKR